jgi:hypothetical protein
MARTLWRVRNTRGLGPNERPVACNAPPAVDAPRVAPYGRQLGCRSSTYAPVPRFRPTILRLAM